jgi:hypothetical protein
MHRFTDLVDRCTAFTLSALSDAEARTIDVLQRSGATPLVKTLQMVQLQRAISAVGMFSLFEAALQDGLGCRDGFREAYLILDEDGQTELKQQFYDLQCAVNVLKHGRGRSYDELVKRGAALSFRILRPGESFFDEGDVSEISTLVEVNDQFVLECADAIRQVSAVIRRVRPDFQS